MENKLKQILPLEEYLYSFSPQQTSFLEFGVLNTSLSTVGVWDLKFLKVITIHKRLLEKLKYSRAGPGTTLGTRFDPTRSSFSKEKVSLYAITYYRCNGY